MNWKHLFALGDQRGYLALGNEKLSTLGVFYFILQDAKCSPFSSKCAFIERKGKKQLVLNQIRFCQFVFHL